MALKLHEFTQRVNLRTLPRVIKIQSGIYCQGCVYEMLGRECSLSTDDLLKIIDISVIGFTAVSSSNTHIDLPLDYPGLFKLIADSQPYKSIEEIVESLKISSHGSGQPSFITHTDINLPNIFIRKKEAFKITDVSLQTDGGHVKCHLLHREPKVYFSLSLRQQGYFIECEDDQFYTLKEIADWKISKSRTRSVAQVKCLPKKDFLYSRLLEKGCGDLILTPVFELRAVTTFSQKILLIPSSLEVDVVDVTEEFDCNSFAQHFSLKDIYKSPAEFFPVVAQLSCVSSWNLSPELQSLLRSDQVIIHQSHNSKRMLASEMSSDSPRHFLIPQSYNGRLKRRPRRFPTAYDLERARSETEEICVVATREFESQCVGLASVHNRDEFVVPKGKPRAISHDRTEAAADAFECLKVINETAEVKAMESVRLPMCFEGDFMEIVSDKHQYTIAEICRRFPLPFNVKVSMRDLSLKVDVLAGVPGLCIEEEISDPCLLMSTFDLSELMEVPVNRTDLTLIIKQKWTGESPTCSRISTVEEISEDCYLTLRRYAVATVTPPPRPPKKSKNPPPRPPRILSSRSEKTNAEDSSCSPKILHIEPLKREEEVSDDKNLPISPVLLPKVTLQNTLAKSASLDNISTNPKQEEDDDDVHDYEYIDEDQLDNIKRTSQERSDKTKPRNTL